MITKTNKNYTYNMDILIKINRLNKKAIEVIDSCKNLDHINSTKKYLNLLETQILELTQKMLGVSYLNNNSKNKKIYKLCSSFNKIKLYLNLKEKQIINSEKA